MRGVTTGLVRRVPLPGLVALVAFAIGLPAGGLRAQQLPDLAQVRSEMEAREAATFPVSGRYSVDFQFGDAPYWSQTFSGEFYSSSSEERLELDVLTPPLGGGPGTPLGSMSEEECLQISTAKVTTTLRRPRGKTWALWRGSSYGTGPPARFSPTELGVRVNWQLYSAHLKATGAKVLGWVAEDRGSVLRVLAGYPGGGDARASPIVLHLSPEHGYYPVRMLFCSRSEEPGAAAIDIDGEPYFIRIEYIVDELSPVGAGWIATAGRAIQFSPAGTRTLRVEPASLETAVDPAALSVPWLSIVRDGGTGGMTLLGVSTNGWGWSAVLLVGLALIFVARRLGARRGRRLEAPES